jgi:DNA mismatch repair protein MutH
MSGSLELAEVRWITAADDRVCPLCSRLGSEAVWVFTEEDTVPAMLTWESYQVWDTLMNVSLVHATYGIPGACRCTLSVSVNLEALMAEIRGLTSQFQGVLTSLQSQKASP